MGKLLSVAVPSYNVEAYLEKTLTSYSDDRFKDDLEVMIVDDGSTDKTAEIAKKYVAKYPEIFRLIQKENGGHGSAVNAGIDHATGKYFRIVDGDDWVDTDNMALFLKKLKSIDTDMVVDVKQEVHMVTGKKQLFPIPDYVQTDISCSFDAVCNREDIGTFIMIHTLTVKTQILKNADIHLLEHVFYVDYEYIVKATYLCKTVTFLNLNVYQYLVGNANQSVSSQNYVKRISHHEAVTKEMLAFDQAHPDKGPKKEYLQKKVLLIIHTHYNIALIFNKNRKEGMQQAKSFRKFLKEQYPQYDAWTKKRYHQACVLHYLGVDAQKLNRMMGRS